MKSLLYLLTLSVGALAAEQLVFQDDFNELDLTKWRPDVTMAGGGNWEFQMYLNSRRTSYVRNGSLYLRPVLTEDWLGKDNVRNGYTLDLNGLDPANSCTGPAFYGCVRASQASVGGNVLNPVTSGMLRTLNSVAIKYGRVEVRAKLPRGDWIWPAIWLLPRDGAYGTWPASGEIDIMESRGNINYPAGGTESFGSTLHWGPFWPHNGYEKTHATYKHTNGTLADDFHTYGLYWDSKGLFTYIDNPANKVLNVVFDKPFFTRGGWDTNTVFNPWAGRTNAAPFDREFYLILNVAVGGTGGYFPEGMGTKPYSNSDPHAINAFYNVKDQWYSTWKGENAAMVVDSVKIWKIV